MKREIKFRAWIPNIGWLADGFSISMDGTEWYDDNGHSYPLSDIELMQFTGLKDKNGKEIYEGDVVRWDDNSNGKYWRVCEIKYCRAHYYLEGHTFDTDNPDEKRYVRFEMGAFSGEYDGGVEIIGNIYSNPELLKEAL